MVYKIWHATSAGMFSEIEQQHRIFAGTVEGNSLDDAFTGSNNIHHKWNKEKPTRSTSIGDVIQDDNGFYMVAALGFQTLTVTDEAEFEKMPKLTKEDVYG